MFCATRLVLMHLMVLGAFPPEDVAEIENDEPEPLCTFWRSMLSDYEMLTPSVEESLS